MKDKDKEVSSELRGLAEQLLETGEVPSPGLPKEMPKLVHELHVYHAELVIQNQELRQSQEALLQARRRYQQLFEEAPVGYLLLDRRGEIKDINATCCDLLNTRRKLSKGKALSLFVDPADHNRLLRHLRSAAASEDPSDCELTFRRSGGDRLAALLTTSRLASERDLILLSTVNDISERKTIELELKESEQYARAILDNVVDGVVIFDENCEIQTANRAAEKIFGYTMGEMQGQSLTQLLPPSGESGEERLQQWVKEQPEAKTLSLESEVVARRRDGSRFPASLSVGRMHHRNRRLFIATLRDISAKKLMEEQLQQAQKMEAVGKLAGGVAHDYNNLLTVISGNCSLALGELPEESPLRKRIQQILNATNRAADLTRQLLAFSRRQVIRPRVVDLNSLIHESMGMVMRMLGPKVTVRTQLGKDLARIQVDPGQIQQIIINLCVNAREAMTQGGMVTLSSEAVHFEDDQRAQSGEIPQGSYVRLSVADDGPGMEDSVLRHIFEPFYTTKEMGRGSGLGLATVYGIVRQHHAYIGVESKSGRGTSFNVYFPVTSPQESRQTAPPQAAKERSQPGLAGRRILVAEDEKAVREMLREVLRDKGYDVVATADGNQALAAASEFNGSLDLLVTDMIMPGLDGEKLAEELRRGWPDLRVLYISGYAEGGRVEMPKNRSRFLRKPFNPREFLRLVEELLQS